MVINMKRVLSLFFALTFVLCAAFATPLADVSVSAETTKNFTVYGLYTSDGDCSLLNMNGSWLLIDMGRKENAGEVVAHLKRFGVKKLDFYLSHYHPDHYGDYAKLAENFEIGKVYLPDPAVISTDYKPSARICKRIKKTLVENDEERVIYLKKGSAFQYGNVKAEVLGPVGNYHYTGSDNTEESEDNGDIGEYVNNCSLTTRFYCGSFSFITCGDIEKKEEKALVAEYGSRLKSSLLKLSHHGLATSSSEQFIKAVAPDYAYALNSAYTTLIPRTDGTGKIRRCFTSRNNVSKYGLPYMVGDEKKNFVVNYNGSGVKLYRDSISDKTELNGFVELTGGDGVSFKTDKYYIKNGVTLTGLQKIDGKLYNLSTGGCAIKGSMQNGKYNPFRKMPEGMCAFRQDCSMYTGFQRVRKYTNYFSPSNGVRMVGNGNSWTLKKIGNSYYAINKNGVIYNKYCNYSGWLGFGNKRRFFDKNTGRMKTGWLNHKGKRYYLNPKTGYRAVGLKKIGKNTYYFVEKNKAAYMYKGGLKKFGKKYRYFDKKTGKMKKGWAKIGSHKYYFDKKTGYRTTGKKKINGKKYRR